MVRHRGVRDLLAFFRRRLRVTRADAAALNTTICFDSYVLYLFGALSSGGRLLVPPPDAHLDPKGLAELCSRRARAEGGGRERGGA